MTEAIKKKAKALLESLHLLKAEELAEAVQLQDYEAKDGSKISTDAEGKVQGDVADGDYELADGSTLSVAEGVATQKAAPEHKEEAAADAPGDKAPEGEADKTVDAPQDEAKPEDALKSSVDALTSAIQQLITGMGLKDEALVAEKAKLAETETKLAAAELAVAEADKKAVDRKPGVGQGITTNLGAETGKLSKAQLALAAARATR